ncbi:MAG TPA: hypothetical protein VFY71_08695 [Planctomycetota bacterium]|nr:hypothetical protein [Planctomycetota bacterium]
MDLRLVEPGMDDSALVELALPVDWTRPASWGAVVITPVTATLDVFVFGPIHLLWIVWTAGGHGQPWLPFCER